MKNKFLRTFVLFFLALTLLGLLTSLKRCQKEEDTKTVEVYTITYKGVVNGKTIEIPSLMYTSESIGLSSCFLPITYVAGNVVYVSGLNNVENWKFNGWYLDEALTVPFDGFVGDNEVGNVILFASLEKEIWSGNYT